MINKRAKVLVVIGLLVVIAAAAFFYQRISSKIIVVTPELILQHAAQVALQKETAFHQPAPVEFSAPPPSTTKNLYFGDLHVHTALSFDSYLFGNRLSLDDAYRVAKGMPTQLQTSEVVRLQRPLDFVAITDHAESFGLHEGCALTDLNSEQQKFCKGFDKPSMGFFLKLRSKGLKRPPENASPFCDSLESEECMDLSRATWKKIRHAAEIHNVPGKFTSFAAYEYSPVLPNRGKHHRNVIFKNDQVPIDAISMFDAATAIDLWTTLDDTCTGACDFLTIPHNMNRTWGLAYSRQTIDGDPYTTRGWQLRRDREPLAEIFQAKGASECAIGAGAVDEECGFEQFIPICESYDNNQCISRNSVAREGLKMGFELEKDLGFNPLRIGFIGSTDTHNSNPGDTEEWDFRGTSGLVTSPAAIRYPKSGHKHGSAAPVYSPGGLAAIWAVENTRDSLFEAMENREVYGTSGTRITLRFFAGWGLDNLDLNSPDLVARAYAMGAPMGQILPVVDTSDADEAQPSFLVLASKDPAGSGIQKIQMIKGWLEGGERKEKVIDIACSDGLLPNSETAKCPDNGAGVNILNCEFDSDKGADTLEVLWRDETYKPEVPVFYYVRVLQNSTCRWSTYDALRLGKDPRDDIPATIQERAWSSPIWLNTKG
ncbi:MAG: hypothetical protein ACI9LU_001263 [Polaribacter sp.]|jgi:hypothetical protein